VQLVPLQRLNTIPFLGALAVCLGLTAPGMAQYRMPCTCPGDCTVPGHAPVMPLPPGQALPGQALPPGQEPTEPVPGTPPTTDEVPPAELAPEQFAALGGDTVSLAQSSLDMAPNSIGDFFGVPCTTSSFVGPTIEEAIVSFSDDTVFVANRSGGPQFIAPAPVDQFGTPVVVRGLVDPDGTGSFLAEPTGDLLNNEIPIYAIRQVYEICLPTPGAAIGRVKLADNNSPLPRDRVFFDYNYFHNTSLNGVDVNRYTPGLEKTFFDGMTSLEFRMPMAGTLDSDVVINSATGVDQTGLNGEFGDLFFGFKALLAASDHGAIAAGMGVTVPTADDVHVVLTDGTTLAVVENEAVYLSPYAAFLVTPSSRTFVQGFVQFNVDTSGNPVLLNSTGTGLVPAGRLNEQALLFLDLSIGRWIYRDLSGPPRGLAWVLEAHYTSTIEDADAFSSGLFQVGDAQQDFDILNLTLGMHAMVGRSVFTVGYGVPVTDDRGFDGELRAFVNRYF
jgi:hypothetical protein